jgi:hypothetical protein
LDQSGVTDNKVAHDVGCFVEVCPL